MNVNWEAVILNYKSKSCHYQLKTKTPQNISQLAWKLTYALKCNLTQSSHEKQHFGHILFLTRNWSKIANQLAAVECIPPVFTLGRFSLEFCSFFITVITCPVPSPSSGTRAICPRNATVHHNTVYYNTTCQFSCEDGYVGSGSQVRRCQRNGTWSGQNYLCQSRSSKLGNDRYVIYSVLFCK